MFHDVAAEPTGSYLERRPVVLPVRLPRDEHPRVLQRQNHRRQLRFFAVAPRVALLREHDYGGEHSKEHARGGSQARRRQQRQRHRHGRLARLVDVVAELPLGDGPRVLVVALQVKPDRYRWSRHRMPLHSTKRGIKMRVDDVASNM